MNKLCKKCSYTCKQKDFVNIMKCKGHNKFNRKFIKGQERAIDDIIRKSVSI